MLNLHLLYQEVMKRGGFYQVPLFDCHCIRHELLFFAFILRDLFYLHTLLVLSYSLVPFLFDKQPANK